MGASGVLIGIGYGNLPKSLIALLVTIITHSLLRTYTAEIIFLKQNFKRVYTKCEITNI